MISAIRHRERLLLAVVLSSFLNIIFGQYVSRHPEFPVCTSTPGQGIPMHTASTVLSNGTFAVSWQLSSDVYARIIDENGQQLNDEFIANTYRQSEQNFPAITALNNGGFVICWESAGQDGSGYGVFAQMFDQNGLQVKSEFQVNSYTNNDQWRPSVATFLNDNFIVCWTSDWQDGSNKGIFAKLFDGGGSPITSEFQVNTYTRSSQQYPKVCVLSDGKFVICWESMYQDGDNVGVFAQIYDAQANEFGSEFQVNSYITDGQSNPATAVLTGDKFVTCWTSIDQDGSKEGIYAQIFDNSGNRVGSEFQVNSYTKYEQGQPSVRAFAEDKFIIAWQSQNRGGSSYGIFAQVFDDFGNKIGPEFQVNYFTRAHEIRPLISVGSSKFAIFWDSWQNLAIFGKFFSNKILHNLRSFLTLLPLNDSSLKTRNPEFKWNEAADIEMNFPWEITYDLYVAEDQEFSAPRIITEIADTTYTIDALATGTSYFWKVLARSWEGDSLWSSNTNGFFIDYDATTDIETEKNPGPEGFRLDQNYPNPFNASTVITYELPAGVANYSVLIRIYDLNGKLIATLVNERQNPGQYRISWNATDDAGQPMPSGIYICSIWAGEFSTTRKMVLLR